MYPSFSRRGLLRTGSGTLALLVLRLRAPSIHANSRHGMKVMVTGGHPGDPECGCGGTIARYSDAGHDVLLMYLNSGQAYCGEDSSKKDCGAIRTAEEKRACEILKSRAAFAGQYDGRSILDFAHL